MKALIYIGFVALSVGFACSVDDPNFKSYREQEDEQRAAWLAECHNRGGHVVKTSEKTGVFSAETHQHCQNADGRPVYDDFEWVWR